MTEQVFWVGDDDAGKRIDAYLSEFDEHGTDNISVDLP